MNECLDSFFKSVSHNAVIIWTNHQKSIVAAVGVITVYQLYNYRKNKARREKWNSAGKDVVILHAIGRSSVCSHISPFVVKVETYLRMAGIKYEFDTEVPMGPKGKLPWITLNGDDIADSQIIIQTLAAKFSKDLSSHLSVEQKAVAKAMQIMLDEHLNWGIGWQRWVIDSPSKIFSITKVPWLMRVMLWITLPLGKSRNMLHAQGLGRHSRNEIFQIIKEDLIALSTYLGDKPYLMGDHPCEIDCCMFGHLSQFVWALPSSPFESLIHNDFPTLVQYTDRMVKEFYPDWASLCTL